ncbi:multidrug and toxin extrusion protein 1-like isoform X1 [Hippocampus zosterae]|uniref:multidrug and toxin extrusion protein 1-like isoform X1 n=1 Tax=Hippocampus zosterae TaxID=109293 RepID=UPI00223E49B9|nr:multidrug and toxin extrusion protein 1-like isoform X1 [Hippocampus zosterae]
MAAGSSIKRFFCWWSCLKIPLSHREEMSHILRMAGPLLLSRVLNYLLPFVVTMFCGRLGNEVMAGYGLASATINITTAATGYGLALACDTLVSQTFGGKNLLRVGVILQRGVLILLLFCLPCWALLLNAQSLLLLMGQGPEVTRIANLYIIAYLPAVPAMFLHNLQASYLQNQGIILPQMYTAAMANVANLMMNYVFLHWLDLGVTGSAAANTLSQMSICALLFAYIRWKKLHVSTWGGWSMESLQEWGSYMRLAVPSMLMKCFEWWLFELGGFFAGMLGEDELATQHAVMMVSALAYMLPFGIQAAACARVGNALGAGDTRRAILTCKVALSLAGAFTVVEGTVLGFTKSVIGFLFTSDQKIVNLVSVVMNAYVFVQFFDGLVCVCTGIFLGTGKQKIPAVANFIGYYGVGLTLSVTLMFVVKLRILGFWLGIMICLILQSVIYIIIIFKLDWKTMTEEAMKRGQKSTHLALMSPAVQEECPADISEGNTATQQQANADRLSLGQLVLRRGLALLAALSILVTGTCVYFLVPLPVAPFPKSNLTKTDSGNSTCC